MESDDITDDGVDMRKAGTAEPAARAARIQTAHRVKVGMIGLAAVLLLIGLAAAIFSTAVRDRPVGPPATMASGNGRPRDPQAPVDQATGEPLAEIGVAPNTGNNSAIGRGTATLPHH